MKNKPSPLKSIVKKTAQSFGFTIARYKTEGQKARDIQESIEKIPDADLYCPTFSPWLSKKFQSYCLPSLPLTLVSPDRLWVLNSLARQVQSLPGHFVECGVYKGGTACLFAKTIAEFPAKHKKALHLFDTFKGMPKVNAAKDIHREGDFADTDLAAVKARLAAFSDVFFHPGIVPETFTAIADLKICFAHIDVDIYEAVASCCEHLYPKLVPGGIMVFDDYGFASCPGARSAVDAWFAGKPEVPLVLPTGQAIVFKLPASH
ncbi:MAG TPA: TylF/MycF/NovP-related O-methyltransferase [Verrucomicrobiae bacterium]